MKARRPATRRPRPRPPKARPDDCLALIPVDGSAVRKRIRAEYEKVQRDLANARAQLDHFHANDQPEFDRWLHRNFGALLTEMRDLARRAAAAEALILEVEEEAWLHQISHRAAYRRVLLRRERANEPDPADSSSSADGDDFPPPPFPDEESADPDQDGWKDRERIPEDKPPVQPRHKHPLHARVKELYRILARRLHPDSRTSVSPQIREWWHQTQDAYARQDVEQLEIILALLEIEEAGQTAATSLSLLQRITGHFKTALRDIRRQLRRCREEPAWNFTKCKTVWILEGQIRHELTSQSSLLKRHLSELETILEMWRPPAKRSPRRRSRPESLFD